MDELKIRTADLSDLNLISALGITTCYEAYFEIDPSHELADYCVKFFDLNRLRSELNDPSVTLLIAEFRGNAIGFAQLREHNQVEGVEGQDAIEVQRIYLLERVKGQKIGAALMEKCCAIGREKGYKTIWLGVWEKNIKAQEFYHSIGMALVGTTDFSDGKNEFLNLVFAKEL